MSLHAKYGSDGPTELTRLQREVERLRGLIEEAHDFLNSDAGVTDGQRIANATLTLAQGLDDSLR